MMKVLIVDDNARMRKTIRSIVGSPSDEVQECKDGSEVLTMYESFHPDWVLMDIEMKMKDGFAATRELMGLHPEAKVIIVTNHSDQQSRDEARDAHAYGFVPKGNLFELRELMGAA